MVRVSVLNDALKSMYIAEKRGKQQVMIRLSSKVHYKNTSILTRVYSTGYIVEFEYVDDHRSEKFVVELNGKLWLNKCGVISPRFDVGVKEIEAWTARLLPSGNSFICDLGYETPRLWFKTYLAFTPSVHPTQRVFTIDGFRNWKKVRDGKNCAFLNHIGKDHNSFNRIAERSYEDLKNQSQHIQNVFENFTSEQIANNRLQLKASIEVVRMLAFQGIAFRGRDESVDSTNRENFLEILNLIVSYNEQIAEVIAKAQKNASYTSPVIQKEILHIFSTKVNETIRKEIGNAKFCIIVDEPRDESMNEQMAIVLRFVDKDGFVRERFFGLVHVSNTAAATLQNGMYFVLSQHKLAIENIRGQGYDGASNMRGGWNGLQALVSNDCPYAYYIHCFAHRLQLALVAASKEVIPVHQFFTNLTFIVNIVCASCSRFEELRIAQTAEIAYLIEIDEIQSGRGLNQIVIYNGLEILVGVLT
ncbi:LOW QUALITY PROTEIN: uncharacterized protein LOC133860528 [Alnus glutinosa]|uniref:LOW QUALITY PROTEIN: uncharacterized protein LOC133860528 n=1 Tax=Alnus glutinosa TaxID=3517 RepID=UPI002D791345|nr:LOW QUALITY PROTEIN: uncharacterized protein LOC133860528 [Alnus glutinosa]